MTWKYWTPERDGHAPDDWVEGYETQFGDLEDTEDGDTWSSLPNGPAWSKAWRYRYRSPFDTLKDQCLALPQDQREALIEAMQKPQEQEPDWADEVWGDAVRAYFSCPGGDVEADAAGAAVIRFMCRPKEDCNYASKDWTGS